MKTKIKNIIDNNNYLLLGEYHSDKSVGEINTHTMQMLKEIIFYLIQQNKTVKIFYEGLRWEMHFPLVDFVHLDSRESQSNGRRFQTFMKIWSKELSRIIVTQTARELYQSIVVKLDDQIIADYCEVNSYDYTIYVVGGTHAVRLHDITGIPMLLPGISGNRKEQRKFIADTRARIKLFEQAKIT